MRLPSGTFVSTHTPGPMSSYCEYSPAPAAHCCHRSDPPTRSSASEEHTSAASSAADEEAAKKARGWAGTFGAGESEERAVRAGELEEETENEPGLEQLHSAECAPAACARAGLRVHVNAPALNERGTLHGRVFGAVRAVRIPSRGYSKYSNWVP